MRYLKYHGQYITGYIYIDSNEVKIKTTAETKKATQFGDMYSLAIQKELAKKKVFLEVLSVSNESEGSK